MEVSTTTSGAGEPDGEFAGQTAVVTGGASGIGRATAERLAAGGARVLVADLRPLPDAPPRVTSLCVDVNDPAAIEALRHDIESRWGPVDALISNAGRGAHERLAEGDPAKWAEVVETNVMGAVRIVRAFVPGMLEAGDGDVVFVSSVAAERAYEWGGIYSASKAALDKIAETLRLEVQPTLRVATVAPGVVETPFFDHSIGAAPGAESIGWGALSPSDVADAVVFALNRDEDVAVNRVVVRPPAQPF